MAIKNFLLTLFVINFVLLACHTAPKRVDNNPPPIVHSGQPAPEKANSTVSLRAAPKKVALILGPGGAKALAHVGVLRVLQQQRIPIEKIIGLEWGALVGGLYANKGQIHDVEWKLYKMQQRGLPHSKGFFSRSSGEESIKNMDDFLQESFLKETVTEARVAFECPSRSVWTGVVAWQNRGLMKNAVKHCLPFPPIFKAQGTFLAGASQASEAVEQLRSQGYNVIILVNVLSSGSPFSQESLLDNLNYAILWQEIKRSLQEAQKLNVELINLESINVDTNNVSLVQFDALKELTNLGEAAAQKVAPELVNKYGF